MGGVGTGTSHLPFLPILTLGGKKCFSKHPTLCSLYNILDVSSVLHGTQIIKSFFLSFSLFFRLFPFIQTKMKVVGIQRKQILRNK